jgi:hypothetical protein
MSEEYTRPQLFEIKVFEATYRMMNDYAVGEGRAIPKKDIWDSVRKLWPRNSKYNPPSNRWFTAHHSAYRDYCAKEKGKTIIHCRDGIFIAETKEEIERYDKWLDGFLGGVKEANNTTQQAIVDNGLSRDGVKLPYVNIRRLLGKPDEETGGEEE